MGYASAELEDAFGAARCGFSAGKKSVLRQGEASVHWKIESKRIKGSFKISKNPTVRPGMEKLPQEVVARQQQRRIKHLEQETKAFRGSVEKLKNPPPPPPPPRPGL
jgi:hypothetical protein